MNTLVSPEENGLGHGIALLGGSDGDTVPDLAAGTAHNMQIGVVWVLFMNADGTVKSHQRITQGEGELTGNLDSDAEFGHDLDAIGDLDGDGVVDLAAGLRQDGDDDRGGMYVLFLNTDGTVKSQQKISNTECGFTGLLDDGDVFGHPPANAGDLNGDGKTDLDASFDSGAVWILFSGAAPSGPLNILDVSPDAVAPGGVTQLTAIGSGFQAEA